MEVLVAELRLKQRLTLALDHLSQWSLCWRPSYGLDTATLQLSDQVGSPYMSPYTAAAVWQDPHRAPWLPLCMCGHV